jgi:hypothetical protein
MDEVAVSEDVEGMRAALRFMALHTKQEDEDGKIEDAIEYGDVELICYHALGLIPLQDQELLARVNKCRRDTQDG